MTRGLSRAPAECPFYLSFELPTRPKRRKGCSARSRICILPQFWASDTSEVTKGSLGELKNLRFTTVLSVRHVRSDERVARRRDKFAFYHSFERPTRTKWRKGRSATSKICVLPQFWASDTHEVTRGLSNPQVRSLRPDRTRRRISRKQWRQLNKENVWCQCGYEQCKENFYTRHPFTPVLSTLFA